MGSELLTSPDITINTFLNIARSQNIRSKFVHSKFIDSNEVYLSIYGSTDLVGPGRFFSFLIFYTVGRTP
jgi:hypothetical protein